MGCLKLSYQQEHTSEKPSSILWEVYKKGDSSSKKCVEYYRYGFQGQYSEEDSETGWNSFELRMYDPVIGRWLSTDPYGEFWSPYVAFGNNPINRVDPDGGMTDCPTCDSDATYAVGAVVENNRGSWQYLGDGEWKDLSTNPSVSSHNQTGYFYNFDDLVVRNQLFQLGSGNSVVHALLLSEQRGSFQPLTYEGFVPLYIQAAGTDNAFSYGILNGFYSPPSGSAGGPRGLGALRPRGYSLTPRGFNGESPTTNSAPRAPTKTTVSQRVQTKVSTMTMGAPKNPWNKFLNANKGKYSGSNWIQQARADYRASQGIVE
ncbi:MAG: RHS repeat-associated core domain-containing protein [Bacteroidota bacterium]